MISKINDQNIKDTMIEYIKYDNYICEKDSKLKEMKGKRTILEGKIVEYMKYNKTSNISIGKYSFQNKSYKSKEGLSLKLLNKSIESFCNSRKLQKSVAKDLVNYINKYRKETIKYSLKKNV